MRQYEILSKYRDAAIVKFKLAAKGPSGLSVGRSFGTDCALLPHSRGPPVRALESGPAKRPRRGSALISEARTAKDGRFGSQRAEGFQLHGASARLTRRLPVGRPVRLPTEIPEGPSESGEREKERSNLINKTDWALDSFLDLERRMIEVLRIVPYESNHLRTFSPILASILFDASSLTESILKVSMDSKRYDSIPEIDSLRAQRYSIKKSHFTINDLWGVFRGDMFYVKPVWLLTRGITSYPWYTWRQKKMKHPAWWKAYNSTKHDRFGSARSATLQNALHALKGCFLCLSSSLEFRSRLVERGVIRSRALTAAQLVPIGTTWEPLQTDEIVVSSTKLLGYEFLTKKPKRRNELSVFL